MTAGSMAMSPLRRASSWVASVAGKLRQNHLWQRVLKHTISVTISFTIVVIPAVNARYGPAAFMAPMTAVFCHSGQRFGQFIESLLLVICGIILGLGWTLLGLYFSSLLYDTNQPAAYTVKAVFVIVAIIFHGYLRSQTPRLFLMVWLILVINFTVSMSTSHKVTRAVATEVAYPILTALCVMLIVNVAVFPEFSGRFLGETTIEALSQTEATLKSAVEWFIEPVKQTGSKAPEARQASSAAPTSSGSVAGQVNGGDSQQQQRRADTNDLPERSSLVSRLAALTAAKGRLRAKLGSCKKAYQECTFEIMYSVLPPRSLKPISTKAMAGLVRNVVALIGTCESKFALIGEDTEASHPTTRAGSDDSGSSVVESSSEGSSDESDHGSPGRASQKKKQRGERARQAVAEMLKELKPQREVASGDADILDSLLGRVRGPVEELLVQVTSAIDLVMACLAYCYNVEKLPSGAVAPGGVKLEEVDLRVDIFTTALDSFDKSSTEALGNAASVGAEDAEADIMPKIEIFLISSYLLSLRQAAEQTMHMLKHARLLVERRRARNDRRRVYLPRKMNWRRWLLSGGEQDALALPETARKDVRTGKATGDGTGKNEDGEDDDDDDEGEDGQIRPRLPGARSRDPEAAVASVRIKLPPQRRPPRQQHAQQDAKKRRGEVPGVAPTLRFRGWLADMVESVMLSEHLGYALKLVVTVLLVSWPAFYGPTNHWYASYHASWAPLQSVLVFEVAIGSSFWVYIVRACGVLLGCLWGFLAYKISTGNLAGLVVLLVVGIIPSAYVQYATPYIKAGMISIVSMSVVSLSIVDLHGIAWVIFLKRFLAFLVGGAVAILVEMVLYPVRARDRLVESISSCISQIGQMEATIAAGVDDPGKVVWATSPRLVSRFGKAKQKAQTSLAAAEAFLPFCLTEPRLRGSFRGLVPIYREIIYALHQIIDRMDGVVALRQSYGTIVLETFGPQIHPYRRNLAASIQLTLFAVNEALLTRMPLPQFLPSSRLAQFRLVNRVRELSQSSPSFAGAVIASHRPGAGAGSTPARSRASSDVIRGVARQAFLSWNAVTAGQVEIIEYLEELVDLAKLLVGVSAFRTGMLDRPTYRGHVRRLRRLHHRADDPPAAAAHDDAALAGAIPLSPVSTAPADLRRRRTPSAGAPGFEAGWRPSALRDVLVRRGPAGGSADARRRSQAAAEAEELPLSLQHVGSRMRQERSMARRMTVANAL